MKTVTVRLPERMAAEIERESRGRGVSRSDVIRERLERAASGDDVLVHIADLVGSVDGLPEDLSERKKDYLRDILHGRKHPR